MKTKLLCWLLLFGLYSIPALSQTMTTQATLPPEQSDPLQELREALAGLNTSRIPTGVLLDRMVVLTNPHRFAGQGDTAATYDGFEQQYWEFYNATLNNSQLPTLDALRSSVHQRVQQDVVPLLMLHYRYNQFSPTAFRDQLLTVDSLNGRVTDGPELSRSPYTTGQVFSVALPVPATGSSMNVYVGREFWLGNTLPPSSVQVDFGDGQGVRQVAMGSTVQVPVSTTSGSTTPVVRVTNPAAGVVAITHRQFQRVASILPHFALGLVSTRKWPGYTPTDKGIHGPQGQATAIAWIKYADSNTGTPRKLRRPLVFVEGIDFDKHRNKSRDNPENLAITQTGFIPLSTFTGSSAALRGGFRNGSAGWNEVVDYNSEYKSLEKFPALRAQLQASATTTFTDGSKGGDYDVIYLDFSDGASLIQDNAMVLVELLEWINQPANRTADAEETMVVGTSMGGQVARFGLAWMEQQGLCHNSKLYVSFDSPHRGANVALGIQHLFDRLQSIGIGADDAKDVVQKQLLREATMQMVVFHFSPTATSYRNEWQAWQASPDSYPSLLRKVAIANGSGQAVPQRGMQPGMQLMHTNSFFSYSRSVTGRNVVYALPGTSVGGERNVVYRYQKPWTFSYKWHYRYATAGMGHYDTAPGSSTRVAGDAHDQSNTLKADFNTNTFMPTISALDVKVAGSIFSPDLSYNVRQNINRNEPNRALYAFDAYFAADDINEPHVQITNAQGSTNGNTSYLTDNSSWIRNELRESAHRLPAALTSVYNFGSPYRRLLPSVQLNAGSELYINNGFLPANGGTSATQGRPSAGLFEMYTSSCGSIVQINSGGIFAIGVTEPYTAVLQVSNKSLVDIRTGGRVDINAGSTLRVQRGGTLVVRDGATFNNYGQIIIETGAFVCLENGASIRGPQPVYQSGVNYFANPDLNLGTLACQAPAPPVASCPGGSSTLNLSASRIGSSGCEAYYRVVASGTNLRTNYRWVFNGVYDPSYDNQSYVDLYFDNFNPSQDVSVSVSSTCTGTGDLTARRLVRESFMGCEQFLTVYPNPSDSEVQIAFKAPELPTSPNGKKVKYDTPKGFKAELYDGRGKKLHSKTTETDEMRLSTAELPDGLYHLTVTRGKGVIQRNLSVKH